MDSKPATDVTLHVYTFKEGLLSRVAHDLRIAATGVQVQIVDGQLTVSVDPNGLVVETAMKKGQPTPRTLSDKDKREIGASLRDEVLETRRHAAIRFTAPAALQAGAAGVLDGTLELHGTSRPLRVPWTRSGDRIAVKVRLDQRSWGIKPYSAMMGALKVQPEVEVVASFALVG